MEIKLLMLDLDDTLLDTKGKLTERIIKTIKRVTEKGINVALASGRMHKSLYPYAKRLGLEGPVVSYNGALIKDGVSQQIISEDPVPLELAKKVLDYARQNNLFCQYYLGDDYFFETKCKYSDDYFAATDVEGIGLYDSFNENLNRAPYKLLMIEDDHDKSVRCKSELLEKYGDDLYITNSKPRYIEVMNKGVSKGHALKELVKIFNIKQEETMAIGDGLNDLEMITSAGIGVAVETGNETLKEVADIICESADENGPAKIIEKLLL